MKQESEICFNEVIHCTQTVCDCRSKNTYLASYTLCTAWSGHKRRLAKMIARVVGNAFKRVFDPYLRDEVTKRKQVKTTESSRLG